MPQPPVRRFRNRRLQHHPRRLLKPFASVLLVTNDPETPCAEVVCPRNDHAGLFLLSKAYGAELLRPFPVAAKFDTLLTDF